MRIVAGTLKGRTIDAPSGTDTRPTIDRVREALFSSLYSLLGGFEGVSVLDAFAGSGALGIEALSRGAERALFFERDAKAAATLKKNLSACKLGSDRARIVQRDAFKSAQSEPGAPFDLVLLDPPYAYEAHEVLGWVATLVQSQTIAPDAVIVYEHALSSKQDVLDEAQTLGFEVIAMKKYGKTSVALMKPAPSFDTPNAKTAEA